MTLKEESRDIIKKSLGKEIAKQIDSFDDPEKYPGDFINQCIYFLGSLIGEENAKKEFSPIVNKYLKKHNKAPIYWDCIL